jgi:septum formation protein
MTSGQQRIILGSRSPRRLELLRLIVPPDSIAVVPPACTDEPDFSDTRDWPAIEGRLAEIARRKCDDVLGQVAAGGFAAVIAADTVIVADAALDGPAASHPSKDADGNPVVLGQPPAGDDWQAVVREWFERYLLGRDHVAASAVCVEDANGRRRECLVKTRVSFDLSAKRWLDWYLGTGEPRGKAGGYAIQGAGGLFVSGVDGSLSNVIGLPIRELFAMLEELGIVAC